MDETATIVRDDNEDARWPVIDELSETDEVRRGPERTKAALLAAALAEFADKGFAGARVDAIASRAGVNKQLISYHFGGKEGLYEALHEKWRLDDRAVADLDRPLADVVISYLGAVNGDRDRARFSVREALDHDPGTVDHEPESGDVANFRERQRAGEIAADLDPAFVLLMVQSVVMSGTVSPAETKRLLGLDPGTPDYVAFMSDQLARLLRRLDARD